MLDRNRDVALDGVLVERMVSGVICELLVGARRDASFGHVLVVGSGGVARRAGRRRRPAAAARRRGRTSRPRSDAFACGRGSPARTSAAAVDAVLAVARLVEERARDLVELDVNPLLVLERGAVAVDALCVSGPTMSGAGAPPPARPGPRRAR